MNYRDYLITSDPASPTLFSVAVAGQGGKIPNVLRGRFTTQREAQRVIDHYLDVQKGGVNGKASAKSGN